MTGRTLEPTDGGWNTPATPTIELVVDAHAALGEGPLWDDRSGTVWWVDITGEAVHATDPTTGRDEIFAVGQPVSAVGLRATGGVILALRDGFAALDQDSGRVELLAPVEADNPANRMNDGKVDPVGRFWAGTMAFDERPGAGALYRLERDLSVVKVLQHLTCSNGLDWTDDHRTMYFIDTPTRRVDRFDSDPVSGAISGRRTSIEIPPDAGWPDGMTLDAEGFLWVCLYDGWAVHRYAPDGRLDQRIELPVAQVTSCAFGGPALEELYITTAQEGFPPGGRPEQPHAGGLFRCRPGVRGRLSHRFAG